MASGETKSVRRSLSRACRTSRPSSYREGQRLFHFDPTNRSVGGLNLIPVAVARDIRQAMLPAIRPPNEALHALPPPPPWRLTSRGGSLGLRIEAGGSRDRPVPIQRLLKMTRINGHHLDRRTISVQRHKNHSCNATVDRKRQFLDEFFVGHDSIVSRR